MRGFSGLSIIYCIFVGLTIVKVHLSRELFAIVFVCFLLVWIELSLILLNIFFRSVIWFREGRKEELKFTDYNCIPPL